MFFEKLFINDVTLFWIVFFHRHDLSSQNLRLLRSNNVTSFMYVRIIECNGEIKKPAKSNLREFSFFSEFDLSEFCFVNDTVCFINLDHVSEMIIFKSILTTLIASIIFRSRWGSSKNWLKLKIWTTIIKFSLSKSVKHTVENRWNFWLTNI